VLWDVTLYSLVDSHLHLQDRKYSAPKLLNLYTRLQGVTYEERPISLTYPTGTWRAVARTQSEPEDSTVARFELGPGIPRASLTTEARTSS
jgi:hypothetical protein